MQLNFSNRFESDSIRSFPADAFVQTIFWSMCAVGSLVEIPGSSEEIRPNWIPSAFGIRSTSLKSVFQLGNPKATLVSYRSVSTDFYSKESSQFSWLIVFFIWLERDRKLATELLSTEVIGNTKVIDNNESKRGMRSLDSVRDRVQSDRLSVISYDTTASERLTLSRQW